MGFKGIGAQCFGPAFFFARTAIKPDVARCREDGVL